MALADYRSTITELRCNASRRCVIVTLMIAAASEGISVMKLGTTFNRRQR